MADARVWWALIASAFVIAASPAQATDEEPVCKSLLQRIAYAAQRANSASDEALAKAKYLERIALMERRALQSEYPSSAAAFDSELARANQSLDAARTRREIAISSVDLATTAYVQQCPQHFAAIHGDYAQLGILAFKSVSESSPSAP